MRIVIVLFLLSNVIFASEKNSILDINNRLNGHESELQSLTNKIEILEREIAQLKQSGVSQRANQATEDQTVVGTSVSKGGSDPVATSDPEDADPVNKIATENQNTDKLSKDAAGLEHDTKNTNSKSQNDLEKDIYDKAIVAFREKRYGDTRAHIANLMKTYPNTSFADRACFWDANAIDMTEDTQKAILRYIECYQTFPKGRKALDSLVKIAINLDKLGKGKDACKILNKISTEFPDSQPANIRSLCEGLKIKNNCQIEKKQAK